MVRRILEIGSGVAVGYATQVLTSVGWEVTKVIPSGYDFLTEMNLVGVVVREEHPCFSIKTNELLIRMILTY